MNNTTTLFYLIDNFETPEQNNIISTDDISGERLNGFDDVYDFLDKLEFEPSQNVLENIFNYSKSKLLV